MIASLKKLLITAGWAPVAVLILHAVIAKTPWRGPMDFPMHFLGGAAMGYFLFHALGCFSAVVGINTSFGRYLFAYTAACTVGVFWEFSEMFSDVFLNTHIQKSLHETMFDLIADASGAFFALALVLLFRHLARQASR